MQPPAPTNHDRIAVDAASIAKATGLSLSFINKDRLGKRLIPFYRVGDRILYNPDRVLEALNAMEEGGRHISVARRPDARLARTFALQNE